MIPLLLFAVLLAPQDQIPVAPPTVTFRGTVVSVQTGAPIADARVTLIEAGRSVSTSADGTFQFDNLPPGGYTLNVSTIGYIFVRRQVDIAATTPADIVVPLAEGTGTYQESVTVSGAATVDPGTSVVDLGSAALQDLRGVVADDPVRAVQALPGVATGNDFQSEFSVRGSAFRQVGIVIDGTATPLLFHAIRGTDDTGSVAMINTDILSHASLSAGPHPQRNGDWLGATLEFDVREGSRDRLAVRTAVSGTNASFVIDGPIGRSKRGSWLVSVRKSYIEWLVRKLEPDISGTIGFVDAQSKAVYDLTSRQQVQFLIVAGSATFIDDTATALNQVAHANSKSTLASFSWHYTRPRFLAQQHLSFVTNPFVDTGRALQQTASGKTHAWIYRGDAIVPLGRTWSFEAGVKSESQKGTETLSDFTSATGGGLRVRNEQLFSLTRTIAGAWAEVSHRTPQSNLTTGVRVSSDSDGHTVTSPWLVAERTVGGYTLVGSAGASNQFASLLEVAQGADPARPEHAWGTDAAVAHALFAGFTAKVGVYHRSESDILRRVQEDRLVAGKRVAESPFPLVGSDLDGASNGADVVFERHAQSGPEGWVSYSWTHTHYHDIVTGEAFDGDFDQRHTVNVFVQQRLSYRMNASVKLRYGSNFPIVGYYAGTPPDALTLSSLRNQVRLPTYLRLDLRASRTFTYQTRRLTLFLEFMNATDHTNYAQAEGGIRNNFDAVGVTERLIPFVPSAGMLLEF